MISILNALALRAVGDGATGAEVNRWLRGRGLKPNAYVMLERLERAGLVHSRKESKLRIYSLSHAGREALAEVRGKAMWLT